MTTDDTERLLTALVTNFPNQKWDDGDLAVWFKNFRTVDVDDIVTALIEHRNTSRFSPKIGDIRALIEKSKGQPVAQQRKGDPLINAWRDQICEGFPNLRNISDTEVVLRYHRSCYMKHVRALSDLANSTASRSLIDAEKLRLSRIHAQLVGECEITLHARCNLSWQDAQTVATYIDNDSEQLQVIIDWIRGTPSEAAAA